MGINILFLVGMFSKTIESLFTTVFYILQSPVPRLRLILLFIPDLVTQLVLILIILWCPTYMTCNNNDELEKDRDLI